MSAPAPGRPRASAPEVRARPAYPALRAVGAVVTALLVGGAVLSTAPAMMTQEGVDTAPLPASMTRLVVEAPRGDVEIHEVPEGGEPRIETTARWTLNRPEVTTREEGATVHVEAPCDGSNLGVCSQDLSLWVPAGTALVVDGTFGDVDITTTGTVEVDVTAGDITLAGAPPRAVVRSTLGQVDVEHTGPEPPELLRVRTTLGDVGLEVPEGRGYAVTAEASQGESPRVRVDDVPGSEHVIDVETTLGSIEILPAATL